MPTRKLVPGAKNARAGRLHIFACLTAVALSCALLGPFAALAAPAYETVVRAPSEQPREDDTAAASVVTSARTPRSGESLPQLLAELPGVTVTRYGSNGSLASLSLRGSAANQVAVYVDGVPLASALTGAVDLGMVPLGPVARIEVYRGSSPLGFGSSAIGGVVALSSEAPAATGAAAHSGLGSFATRFGGGQLAWVGQRLSLVARASVFDSRADFPYLSDNGTLFDPSDDRTLKRENNQIGQREGSLRATLTLGRRRDLSLALAALDRDQGLPARGTTKSYQATLARRRGYASLVYQGRDDLGEGGLLRAVVYGLGAEQRFADPRGEIGFGGAARTRDRSLAYGATVNATWPVLAALSLAGILDARHEGFTPHDELRADTRPPGARDFAAMGLAATLSLGEVVALSGTLRAEAAHDTISPAALFPGRAAVTTEARELLPIGRVGVLVTPGTGALRFTGNLGSYARLPTLFERYGNGGTVVGNPALAPERSEMADLTASLRDELGAVTVAGSAGVFGYRTHGLIALEESSYFARYANLARARVVGGELAARAALGPWHVVAQGTYLDARDRSDDTASAGRRLPRLPALRAYLRPELRAFELGAGFFAGLYGELEVEGARYADPSNLVEQPGRQIVGAGASLAYAPAGLRALLSAYNLGDVRGSDVLEYPLPGRSFFATVEIAYSKKESAP